MDGLHKGDVVVTAFPFAEGHTTKVRPAVVYAGPWTVENFSICWVLMITSSRRERWPGDVVIANTTSAGLPGTSLVRPLKIVCIDVRNILLQIGALDTETLGTVQKNIRKHLA